MVCAKAGPANANRAPRLSTARSFFDGIGGSLKDKKAAAHLDCRSSFTRAIAFFSNVDTVLHTGRAESTSLSFLSKSQGAQCPAAEAITQSICRQIRFGRTQKTAAKRFLFVADESGAEVTKDVSRFEADRSGLDKMSWVGYRPVLAGPSQTVQPAPF